MTRITLLEHLTGLVGGDEALTKRIIADTFAALYAAANHTNVLLAGSKGEYEAERRQENWIAEIKARTGWHPSYISSVPAGTFVAMLQEMAHMAEEPGDKSRSHAYKPGCVFYDSSPEFRGPLLVPEKDSGEEGDDGPRPSP